MRKLTSLILTLVLALTLASCASPKPDATVKGFMDLAKTSDFSKMSAYINPSNVDSLNSMSSKITSDSTEKYFWDYIKAQNSKMTYEIKSSSISGTTATVTVNCKFIDSSPLLKAVVTDYFKQAVAAAFSGTQMTDSQQTELIGKILTEQQKNITDKFTETTLNIKCVQIDKKWYIDSVDEGMGNVITANILAAAKEIASAFSDLTGKKQ